MRSLLVYLVAMMAIIGVLGGITLSCSKVAEKYTANRTVALATTITPDWWEDEANVSEVVSAMKILAGDSELWFMEVTMGSTMPALPMDGPEQSLVLATEPVSAEWPTIRVYSVRRQIGDYYKLHVEVMRAPNPSGRSWTMKIQAHAGHPGVELP